MDKFLEIGKIVAVQGLKGEVRAEAWCDYPEFLCEFETLYFDKGKTPVEITSAHPQKNIVILKIKDIVTAEQAQELRGKILYVDREDTPLEEGCYFVQDLIGLSVIDNDNGVCYGKISDITSTGANDVYHVMDEKGKVRLIPSIPDVVIDVDITGGKIMVHILEGLFDED